MRNNIIKQILVPIFLTTFSTHTVVAQIGINTQNPQANILVHIDPKKNNSETGTTTSDQTGDDIVITTIVNIGTGTIAPTTKLHIATGGTSISPNPQLTIEDGYQGVNKVLTSNANGFAHWEDYVPGAVLGTFDVDGVDIMGDETLYKNTRAKMTLDPGKWIIIYAFTVNCNRVSAPPHYRIWVRSTIGDQTTLDANSTYGTPSPDILGRTEDSNSVWADIKGVLTSRYIIDNTSGIAKDYYFLAGNVINSAAINGINMPNVGKNTGDCSFYAFRIIE
ncbi:hypothetical protein CLV62_101234 [Dysgonomonas alginatilytica]|uniref:Uncharacterized protein n=1 Tax=Dysgonomonas alginatilytica TaxID=1605892 RepID=A0A2V3PWK7_9BACT|nr:hypothetical protein [Dysgonomonas alginatilytica]PXV68968.1 hypothetical protein CLV62_101234 [Dysgonomonas alginatilytica]